MNLLGAGATAIMKATVDATLVETWTINKRTYVNKGGGASETKTARAENIPARSAVLVDRGAREQVVAGATREKEEIMLTTDMTDRGIKATDQAVAVDGPFAGRSFEVVREITTQHKRFCRRFLCKAE